MTCVVTTEGGRTIIACSRKSWPKVVNPKCERCGKREALFECDFADPSHESGTCDVRLCNQRDCLATRWNKDTGERRDICRVHIEAPVAA